ncbi:glycerol-3-phosphate dehydrogenase, partial [Breznakia sp. OttesenSCG-928-G09]|nr:glycerol-3-phosphate dehydrogenase [Breznakia sp. OttesenSCG-928-G09]
FQAGYEVGKENSADIFWDKNKNTVEGVRTAKVVHEIATKNNIDMPIINETYKILYEGKEPKTSAKDLMLRELKAE